MFMQAKAKKPLFNLHIINQSSPEGVHCISSNLTALLRFLTKVSDMNSSH